MYQRLLFSLFFAAFGLTLMPVPIFSKKNTLLYSNVNGGGGGGGGGTPTLV